MINTTFWYLDHANGFPTKRKTQCSIAIFTYLLYFKEFFVCLINVSINTSLYLNWFIISSYVFICPSLKAMLRKENCFIDCHSNLSSKLLEYWNEVKWLSRVWLFVTPWTVAYQALLSMGFSRQEHWSGLPFPSPGDLPNPGIEPGSPALEADALTSEPPGKP